MSSPTRSENSDIEQLIDAEDNNDAIFATALTGTSPTTTSTLLTTGNGTGATPPTAASRSRSPSIEILTSEDDEEEEEEEESDVGERNFQILLSKVFFKNDIFALKLPILRTKTRSSSH